MPSVEAKQDNPEEIICAVLRREAPQWSEGASPAAITAFIDAGRYHGVLQLLDAEFSSRDSFKQWPVEILSACHKATEVQTMYELTHRAELARVFDAFAFANISPLLLKGT